MDEFSHCFKCGHQTTEPVAFCPKCRGRMFSSTKVRRLGWLQAIAGGFLVALLLFVLGFEIFSMSSGPDRRWEGTVGFTVVVLILEGLWLGAGLASLGAGVYQIKNGKRHKGLVYGTLAVGAVAFAVMVAFVVSQGNLGR